MTTSLHFSTEFLQAYGCANCVWKSNNQCPEGFTRPDEKVEEGYCSKLPDFMLGLASPGDSISAVKEKYHLYLQEMQVLEDRKDYLELKREYVHFIETVDQSSLNTEQKKQLQRLTVEMNGYKIWWARLSESVVKGLSRIADREQRIKTEVKPQLTVQQLNVLMKEGKKYLDVPKDE